MILWFTIILMLVPIHKHIISGGEETNRGSISTVAVTLETISLGKTIHSSLSTAVYILLALKSSI